MEGGWGFGGRGRRGWGRGEGRRVFCREINNVGTFVKILHTNASEGDTIK